VTHPVYPRVPHLAPGPGITRDDLVLSEDDRNQLFNGWIRIEEKLDGANISFSMRPNGHIDVASRGGLGTIDRGRHLGRARAWAAERSDDLRRLLQDGSVLYGEWLLTRHGVAYSMLPDLFVGFDLLDPAARWVSVRDRDEQLKRAGLVTPNALGDFREIDLPTVDALMGPSAFGASGVEGLIVRAIDSEADAPRLAKRLAEGVSQGTNDAFGRSRDQNRMARPVANN
jgi:RNA ligase